MLSRAPTEKFVYQEVESAGCAAEMMSVAHLRHGRRLYEVRCAKYEGRGRGELGLDGVLGEQHHRLLYLLYEYTPLRLGPLLTTATHQAGAADQENASLRSDASKRPRRGRGC